MWNISRLHEFWCHKQTCFSIMILIVVPKTFNHFPSHQVLEMTIEFIAQIKWMTNSICSTFYFLIVFALYNQVITLLYFDLNHSMLDEGDVTLCLPVNRHFICWHHNVCDSCVRQNCSFLGPNWFPLLEYLKVDHGKAWQIR